MLYRWVIFCTHYIFFLFCVFLHEYVFKLFPLRFSDPEIHKISSCLVAGTRFKPTKAPCCPGRVRRAPPSPGLFPALTPLALTVAPYAFTWVQTPSPQSTRRMTEDSLLPVSTRQSWSLKCESSGNCFRWFVTSQGHTVTTRMHIVH